MPDPTHVRSLFARIARRYDFVNRVLSLGIDRRWRRELLAAAGDVRGRTALDVCCGTGDVAQLLARAGAQVVGVDFTREMLLIAQKKRTQRTSLRDRKLAYVHGDALALPVAPGRAELVTIAFGIRNLADRSGGLREMARAARPGGRLVVLEFGSPQRARWAAAYRLYLRRILPRVGGLVSGDGGAYRYFQESVAAWPGPAELQRELEQAGFLDCGHRALSGGIAYLHWGTAPVAGGTSRA